MVNARILKYFVKKNVEYTDYRSPNRNKVKIIEKILKICGGSFVMLCIVIKLRDV